MAAFWKVAKTCLLAGWVLAANTGFPRSGSNLFLFMKTRLEAIRH